MVNDFKFFFFYFVPQLALKLIILLKRDNFRSFSLFKMHRQVQLSYVVTSLIIRFFFRNTGNLTLGRVTFFPILLKKLEKNPFTGNCFLQDRFSETVFRLKFVTISNSCVPGCSYCCLTHFLTGNVSRIQLKF